ncbi:SAM-dependent methyltransferase [Parabacteroides sp. 52]|uniref:class I SAM-dependent methyltransferase n=1 Tax=unclassified Parabacteroides TaxID=2649774 RepID=UPI0013D32A5B|nr:MULTISPECIES: class I SAM-dependent methyltransferase [unclassified Parabacteroides]MDH6535525.1 putative O-methyltransferase YrrM [Parabacteroides sp. PM5-20]NDV56396.1 SAM-dependent methyltransferase [Parabacteroides sp. 52]
MKSILPRQSWRKTLLPYRKIRYNKGHGVHSPFVFNLITKVINDRCSFYCFQEIENVRKHLLQKNTLITYPDRRHKNKSRQASLAAVVKREAIQPKRGALLFRLTNYFKAEKILQIGPSMGISTLYLSAYAPGLTCVSLERVAELAMISGEVYKQAARTAIDLQVGSYRQLLPGILQKMGKVDFVFFNGRIEQECLFDLVTACLPYTHENSVFVVEDINRNKEMRTSWKKICSLPEVSVSLDLFSLGIVLFNKKLHKRNYIVYF